MLSLWSRLFFVGLMVQKASLPDTEGFDLKGLGIEIMREYIRQSQNPPRYIPPLSIDCALVNFVPVTRNRSAVLDTGSLEHFIKICFEHCVGVL